MAAYFPALRGGFLWDDERHVTAPALRSAAGLAAIWTDIGATQQYYPVMHSAFWLQHRLWGDATPGYHLTNLALHALAAFLFGLVLHRLAIPGAWLAAALFALHPVHVESVAWISEQKNTLSTVFALAATLGYLRFDRTRRGRDYAFATLGFVLALLTKSVVAMLPVALLLLAWWRHGKIGWSRDVRPLLPWIVMGAAAGLFTAWLERTLIGAEGEAFALSALQRALLAPHTIWFYLGELLWPVQLTFIYPRWEILPTAVATWLPLLGLAVALGLLWLRRARTLSAVAALYVVLLFPVLGFLNVFPFLYSFVADHFQYFASLPVIALAAAGLVRLGPGGRAPALLLVLGLGILTWRQAGMYRDIETLYRTTIARNPACWMAHNNLGKELLGRPDGLAEATACFQRALELRPAYAEAHTNLGLALTYAGRPGAAIAHHRESLRLKPGVFQTHNNLGIALARSGRAEESLAAFARAADLNPRLPNIHENWAKALLLLGRTEEAAARQAVAARLRQP